MDKRYINCFLALFLYITTPVPSAQAASSPTQLFNQGVGELKSGDPQTAVDLFTELIMDGQGNAKVHKNRGVALLKLGKVDLAIHDFEKALEINPDLPGLYSNLGAAWYYKQAYEKAVTNYSHEIKQTPRSHISYFNRALSRIQLNQQTLAMADIQHCLELEPDFAGALQLKERMTGFEIQTGAFLNRTNAVNMKQTLSTRGINAHILCLEDHKKKPWYLVRFALFTDPDNARLFCKRFVEQTTMPAIVRPWGKF